MNNIEIDQIQALQKETGFSGTFSARGKDKQGSGSSGFANLSEKWGNQVNTRFNMASGSQIFTATAVCQLIEEKKLNFDTLLKDCLDITFPYFDEDITIKHLLLHTSGIPDYFEDETMRAYEDLWIQKPMYRMKKTSDYLSLFQQKKMVSPVEAMFHANHAGYILLGLIIEQVTGMEFSEYIEQHVFEKAGMKDSGYFKLDQLPERTAVGYIETKEGESKTNQYAIPIKGGPDRGAYTTSADMVLFWEALMSFKLLSKEMTTIFLEPHVALSESISYGYVGYIERNEREVVKYILMGYDPGANFRSFYRPAQSLAVVVCSNKEDGAHEMVRKIEEICIK